MAIGRNIYATHLIQILYAGVHYSIILHDLLYLSTSFLCLYCPGISMVSKKKKKGKGFGTDQGLQECRTCFFRERIT